MFNALMLRLGHEPGSLFRAKDKPRGYGYSGDSWRLDELYNAFEVFRYQWLDAHKSKGAEVEKPTLKNHPFAEDAADAGEKVLSEAEEDAQFDSIMSWV